MTDHWFEPIADHLGSAYLRYSFTKGTRQEIDFIMSEVHLVPGMRVLDVGCGPGRHALELARRGIEVVGIDISETFIDLASQAAESEGLSGLVSFHRHDARLIPLLDGSRGAFDVVICLCQGAFGLMRQNSEDELVLKGMAESLNSDGTLVLSAFNAYFAVKYHTEAQFDADAGVSSELTEIRNPQGETKEVSLHTGCYTPRELRLLCREAGLDQIRVFGAEPGDYGHAPPSTETAEFLVFASR